jgi:hypothetical protein
MQAQAASNLAVEQVVAVLAAHHAEIVPGDALAME